MMKKWAYPALLSFAVLLPLTATATTTENTAMVQTQAEKAQGIWIDVRTPEEYAEGHIEGAVNIPYEQIGTRITEVAKSKDEPINLYCKSGRRAGIALAELEKLGYTNTVNQGGYQDLLKKGIK